MVILLHFQMDAFLCWIKTDRRSLRFMPKMTILASLPSLLVRLCLSSDLFEFKILGRQAIKQQAGYQAISSSLPPRCLQTQVLLKRCHWNYL